jgi:hypothetical protein
VVFLGFEEGRGPPTFETLQGIPCLIPKSFKVEHEYNFFDRIFEVLDIGLNDEAVADECMRIYILDKDIDLC